MVAPAIPRMPSRIGPYRVVARLASGGMAEVYLATMNGAAGFERAVVIKRSLPHLADEPELRSTLLDEARLMSRIRHPNVVSVQELAEDRDCFYLVMEHLRGESLSGFARAIRRRRHSLDPGLAVLIASELCAGLHAAHELTDEEGTPLHVVHRDVSPQNVFLTFDGEVKVLDFGIARYDGRGAARTKTGICKGKFAYMSPEQYAGELFDRRADVFAIGVILHELLTGRPLFARKNAVETLRAIVNDPYPTPRERAPGLAISDGLEAVVMKALARDPGERFASAEALRVALRVHLRELDRDHDARERLIQLAVSVLPEKLAETQDLVRRAREAGSGSAARPARLPQQPRLPHTLGELETKAESPNAIDVPREADDIISLATSEIELVLGPSRAAPRPLPRARALVIGATAVGLTAIGVATITMLPRAIADVAASEPARASPGPASTAASVVTALPVIAPAPAGPGPGLPSKVRVHVEATPRGARVRTAGARCLAPCDLELARGTDAVELTIEREGFVPVVQAIVPEIDQRVVVRLVRAPRRGTTPRSLSLQREAIVAEPVFYLFD